MAPALSSLLPFEMGGFMVTSGNASLLYFHYSKGPLICRQPRRDGGFDVLHSREFVHQPYNFPAEGFHGPGVRRLNFGLADLGSIPRGRASPGIWNLPQVFVRS